MFKKFAILMSITIVIFLAYVSTRESKFVYERSGVINAPAAQIYPYLVDFKKGAEWSPYEKGDTQMKKTYAGSDGQVGSTMEFEGDHNSGTGKLELLKTVPNELAEVKLTMIKPLPAENLIQYKLTPEGDGTRFTWTMSGDGGFMTKLITVFIDCEKLVGGQFEMGIANLKEVVEAKK